MLQKFTKNERVVIGVDLNGHVGGIGTFVVATRVYMGFVLRMMKMRLSGGRSELFCYCE